MPSCKHRDETRFASALRGKLVRPSVRRSVGPSSRGRRRACRKDQTINLRKRRDQSIHEVESSTSRRRRCIMNAVNQQQMFQASVIMYVIIDHRHLFLSSVILHAHWMLRMRSTRNAFISSARCTPAPIVRILSDIFTMGWRLHF